jgi:two-component system nitrogen regulation sensor histidine kinase GlnL
MFANSFHKRILENMSTAVFLLDRELNVLYLNPAAEMLLQISHRRIQHAHFPDLFAHIDETLVREFRTILDAGHTYTQREGEFVLHNGEHLLLDCTASGSMFEGRNLLIIEMQQKDRLLRISREEHIL